MNEAELKSVSGTVDVAGWVGVVVVDGVVAAVVKSVAGTYTFVGDSVVDDSVVRGLVVIMVDFRFTVGSHSVIGNGVLQVAIVFNDVERRWLTQQIVGVVVAGELVAVVAVVAAVDVVVVAHVVFVCERPIDVFAENVGAVFADRGVSVSTFAGGLFGQNG